MDAIKTYLDNVFAAYPQTNEVLALKKDMLANMEEKYTTLRQSGKNEHEAAYSVIANFGNIEEITAEWGLKTQGGESGDIDGIALTLDEAEMYLAGSKKSGIWIGLGVWLIIAGVSTTILLEHPFIMFVAIAIAVMMFIFIGTTMDKYKAYTETAIRLDPNTREMIEHDRVRAMRISSLQVALGVAFILISVGAFTVVDFPVALFLNIVGFSVFLFILAGTYSSAFDVLLGKNDYSNKDAVTKAGRIIGTLAAIYWPIVVGINMYLLFVVQSNYFWVVWPIAGVVFGAVCAGIAVWYGSKRKERTR